MASTVDEDLSALLDAYIATALVADPPPELPLWQYTERELLAELKRGQQRSDAVAARQLALLAEAERRESTVHQASLPTAGWLVDHNTHSARSAREEVQFAVALAQSPSVGRALERGQVSVEQAKAIVNGLRRLPEDLDDSRRQLVAGQLVRFAADFGPAGLARLVNRAIEVVAPEVAEDADRRSVERLDAEQRRDRYFTWRQNPDGSWTFHGKLPSVPGQQLINVVRAVAKPHRSSVLLAGGQITGSQANADALCGLVEHYASCGIAPDHGADRPRVIVTIDFDTLRGKLGTATLLDADCRITAQEARRIACDAHILPAVLGSKSKPLDVGRSKRLFTKELRHLLILRDRGCTFPGCDRPPSECEAHHRKPWWAGGETSLDSGVLLCTFHHHTVEPNPNLPIESQWLIRLDDRGLSEFAAPLRPNQAERVWKQHHRFRS